MENFNPSDPLVQKNKSRIKQILIDTDATIFFVANSTLKEQISKDDEKVKDMPKSFKNILLSGNGIRIQKRMLLDWIDNKLDKKNSYVLSQGEIRITEDSSVALTKSKDGKKDK